MVPRGNHKLHCGPWHDWPNTVLGLTWLEKWNPLIYWKKKLLKLLPRHSKKKPTEKVNPNHLALATVLRKWKGKTWQLLASGRGQFFSSWENIGNWKRSSASKSPMCFMVELLESSGNIVILAITNLFSKQVHFVACLKIFLAWTLAKLFLQHVYSSMEPWRELSLIEGRTLCLNFGRNFWNYQDHPKVPLTTLNLMGLVNMWMGYWNNTSAAMLTTNKIIEQSPSICRNGVQ